VKVHAPEYAKAWYQTRGATGSQRGSVAPPDQVLKARPIRTSERVFRSPRDSSSQPSTIVDGQQAVMKQAEGEREAAILRAEGNRQAAILEAEGRAKAIETVSLPVDERPSKLASRRILQLRNSPMLTPEEIEIVRQLADREGQGVAQRMADALKARGRAAERADLSEDEAMELAVAEQHAMRAERRATPGRRRVKAG